MNVAEITVLETQRRYNCGQCCEPEAAEEPLSGTLPIRPGQGVTVLQDHSTQDTPRPAQFRAHPPVEKCPACIFPSQWDFPDRLINSLQTSLL